MCHCRNILGLSSELGKETSRLSKSQVVFVVTQIDLRYRPDHSHHTVLETLVYCLRRRNCFVPLSPEVSLCETCSSFPYSMLIGLPVACPGILFLAANLNMHLRFLFNLLKWDCDNFISIACTAPLVFKRQSDWLWVSGTWPWERYRLFMLWNPSLSGPCARACVWYSFVMPWQTQDTVLWCLSPARLATKQFYWACPGSAGSSACSLLPSWFCFTACFQLRGG